MASLTIRNLGHDLYERLRVRAALSGRSVEEEARVILCVGLGGLDGPALLERARKLFGPEHGVELDLPDRLPSQPAPSFE